MKCLVIGAAGFVGGYLIDELKSQNYEVYATKLAHETVLNTNAEVIDLDITKPNAVQEIIEKINPEVIFHLAAQSSVKISWEKPALTANINIIGAINIFESVKNFNKNIKIIVIGSSEEYGKIDYSEPVTEDTNTNPSNIYAITKLTQEQIAKTYVSAYGMDIVMTRSFNHIGAKQLPNFVVADFCNQVARIEKGLQEPIIRVGNLSASRDFTNVKDVVSAYVILAKNGVAGEIYNVGSGEPVKIEDILNIILSYSSAKIKVEIDSSKFRPIDVPVICADVKKLQSLGWKRKISLSNSIEEVLNYYRNLTSEN